MQIIVLGWLRFYMLAHWKESYDKPRQHIKKQRRYFADKGLCGFSSSHVQIWELEYKKGWALKNWCFQNCGAGEDSWESLGERGDQTSQFERKSTLNIHWKDWCWIWDSGTLATWCEEPTHWKRPWCWERLRVKGEGGSRGWDHQQLNGHKFEQTPGDTEWQESLLHSSL